MQLVGMYDSPFVRRVAISLHQLQLPFEHRSVSVFRQMDAYRRLNPLLKAPTLICDDGTLLVDSTLILDDIEAHAGQSLLPADPAARRQALSRIGLALVAAEKSVQVYYEYHLRPAEKQHAPWLERVGAQMETAFSLLEAAVVRQAPELAPLDQAGISSAVAWRFAREYLPQQLDWSRYPALADWSRRAEALPAFLAAPFDA